MSFKILQKYFKESCRIMVRFVKASLKATEAPVEI